MPTISQVGQFTSGTYGFPVQFTCVDQNSAPINLAAVSSIQLHVVRPELTEFFTTNLTITNIPGGVIQYTIAKGDLSFGGIYKYALTITFNNGSVLVLGGTFTVLQAART